MEVERVVGTGMGLISRDLHLKESMIEAKEMVVAITEIKEMIEMVVLVEEIEEMVIAAEILKEDDVS